MAKESIETLVESGKAMSGDKNPRLNLF